MKRKLQKNKTSLISTIPQAIVEYFGLKVGDVLDFKIDGKTIRAVPVAPSKSG